MTADFSENYSFVLQDAAQGFHWNNSQATLHPIVAYYHNTKEVCHLSYVVISDCLHHDTVAVHLFQTIFIHCSQRKVYISLMVQHLNIRTGGILLICAITNMTSVSMPNGIFRPLRMERERVMVWVVLLSDWQLGLACNDQIMMPRQLFGWARTIVAAAHFGLCSTADYVKIQEKLESRCLTSRTIPDTRRLHSSIPISNDSVQIRRYSFSISYKEKKVVLGTDAIEHEQIAGFVTCWCEREWFLACVLEVNQDENMVTVTCLHPPGPSSSFLFPSHEDICILQTSQVLSLVDPRTRTGRTYTLSKKKLQTTTKRFNDRMK